MTEEFAGVAIETAWVGFFRDLRGKARPAACVSIRFQPVFQKSATHRVPDTRRVSPSLQMKSYGGTVVKNRGPELTNR